MRVRVDYTIEVSDDYRRAINVHYGKPGLATRAEVVAWAREHGSQGDDDLMWDLQKHDDEQDRNLDEGERDA